MDKKLRERDLLWCRALIATLNTEDIELVTAEFNRIRPQQDVQVTVRRCQYCDVVLVDGKCGKCGIQWTTYHA